MGNAMDCAQKRNPNAPDKDVKPTGKYKVQFAASPLFGIPGLASAYHTSILVDDEEYFFSDSGICYDDTLISHQGKPAEMFEVGRTDHSGTELWWALQPHFKANTYDLLHKNCNSFTDCALFFLMRQRLDKQYSALERLGQSSPEMVRAATNGMYTPNAVAADFDVELVVDAVTKLGTGKRVSGPPRPRRMTLTIGAEVILVGLKSAAELNGQAAVISRYNVLTGRWEARLKSTGEQKAFRAENMRPEGEVHFQVGDAVRIQGLASEAGQALNGLEGTVASYLHDGARYEVRINDRETKALKSENLSMASSAAS